MFFIPESNLLQFSSAYGLQMKETVPNVIYEHAERRTVPHVKFNNLLENKKIISSLMNSNAIKKSSCYIFLFSFVLYVLLKVVRLYDQI